MALRAAKGDEDADRHLRGINNLDRVFSRAGEDFFATLFNASSFPHSRTRCLP
jgi:hypothetical protein